MIPVTSTLTWRTLTEASGSATSQQTYLKFNIYRVAILCVGWETGVQSHYGQLKVSGQGEMHAPASGGVTSPLPMYSTWMWHPHTLGLNYPSCTSCVSAVLFCKPTPRFPSPGAISVFCWQRWGQDGETLFTCKEHSHVGGLRQFNNPISGLHKVT